VRKESNGKLRWRMLPLHAALMFQAPFGVVEALLEAHPAAAAAKDDQGMLPLHLALRNFGSTNIELSSSKKMKSSSGSKSRSSSGNSPSQQTTSSASSSASTNDLWQILEELLTVFPAAVFSKDRKGRTPLQGGLLATSSSNNNSNSASAPVDHHKTALTVLQLWTTIQTAGEKNTVAQQQQQQAEVVQQELQRQHVATLEQLRNLFWNEQSEVKRKHEQQLQELQTQLDESTARERRWRDELDQLEAAGGATATAEKKENEQLRALLQQVLDGQSQRDEAWQQLARQQEESLQEASREMAAIVGVNTTTTNDPETLQYKNKSRSSRLHESQRSLADQILEDLEASSSAGL